MRRSHGAFGIGIFCLGVISAGLARAETIELVTYYPAPGAGQVQTDRQHIGRATVGAPYSLINPVNLPDGTLAVSDRLGVGTAAPAGPLHVVGRDDRQENVLFLPGNNTVADPGVPDIWVGIGTASPQAPLQVGRSSLFVQSDQGGSIELGGNSTTANTVTSGMPYIDFHFGRVAGVAQDFNTRLINRADGILDVQTSTGGAAAQTRLSIGNNIGVGTTLPQTTSPLGVTSGNLDANDVYLRSTGRWLSQAGGVRVVGIVGPTVLNLLTSRERVLGSISGNFNGRPVLILINCRVENHGGYFISVQEFVWMEPEPTGRRCFWEAVASTEILRPTLST